MALSYLQKVQKKLGIRTAAEQSTEQRQQYALLTIAALIAIEALGGRKKETL